MPVPTLKALRKELDGLGWPARCARLGRLGAAEAASPKLAALVEQLEAGDAHDGAWALALAQAARLEDPVARALHAPSVHLRCRAAALSGALLSGPRLQEALPRLAPDTRRRVLRSVARARRSDVVQDLFRDVWTRHGPLEALPLLAALPGAHLASALPELGHAVTAWRTLAERHPDAVLEHLRQRLSEAPDAERAGVVEALAGALRPLARLRGEALLQLLLAHGPDAELPRPVERRLPALARRHPDLVFALLTRRALLPRLASAGVPRPLLRHLDAFTVAQRHALARHLAQAPGALSTFLRALPPSQRAAAALHAYGGALPRLVDEAVLRELPHAQRDQAAQSMLAQREVQQSPPWQLRLHALRVVEHGRGPLETAARASKAEDRALAVGLLVDCTGRSRRGLGDTLRALERLKNDQDPVRLAAVQALARVPPRVVEAGDVAALSALVDWVVQARDTSHATRAALQALAFRLLADAASHRGDARFDWAFETLRKLAGQAGTLSLPRLDRLLPRGTEQVLLERLLPFVRAAKKRESFQLALSLAQALGRRAWGLDPLQELLGAATKPSADWSASLAVQLYLAPPRTRDARVAALLKRDESHVTLPPVFWHLHRRRQDLLDPFLKGRVLKGHYWSGKKVGWIPPAFDGLHRWLPRQQEAYAALLARVAEDPARPSWERASVLGRLGRVPTSTVGTFAPFLKDREVVVVEAALGALAWLDAPEQALPLLLAHLDSDRARVAMYAVPRVARRVTPAALGAALEALLTRSELRVTVRKEALRLLGAHRSERSLELLSQALAAPGVHPDVQIAAGHGLRAMLDDARAWGPLEALARSPVADVAQSLLDPSPATLPPSLRPRYAQLLLRVAEHPELRVRQRAWVALAAWTARNEEALAPAAAARLVDLVHGAEWKEATATLAQAVRGGRAWAAILEAAGTLLAAPVPAGADAGPDRDLPARQRLLALLGAVLAWPPATRLARADGLRALAVLVAREPSHFGARARLLLGAVDFAAPEAPAAAVAALAAHAQAEPLSAVAVSHAVRDAATAWPGDAAPLLACADRVLAPAPLAALVLVAEAGRRSHWAPEAAERLRALRAHPSASVREAACGVLTAAE